MTDMKLIHESELQSNLDRLLEKIHYRPWRQKVRLGKFQFDAIAQRKEDGAIAVVELKVDMHHRTLGQLFLYQRALSRCLAKAGYHQPVHVVLISTFLDEGLIELVGNNPDWQFELFLCVGLEPPELFSAIRDNEKLLPDRTSEQADETPRQLEAIKALGDWCLSAKNNG